MQILNILLTVPLLRCNFQENIHRFFRAPKVVLPFRQYKLVTFKKPIKTGFVLQTSGNLQLFISQINVISMQ